ncbi:MAG: CinA family protein [Candidatus Omnitrophica bacterium]|nr:CinA family protein [Candidatus Omnitrophota bacterium]
MSNERKLVELFKEKKLTISTAESCTGGLVSSLITDIPGSSAMFKGGVVAYANEIKTNILFVKKDIIEKHGAVSKEVAALMAESALKKFKTVFAVSLTGIAGPKGCTAKKPVGLVFIGVSGRMGTTVKKYIFEGTRKILKRKFAEQAIKDVLKKI